jgi:hypothetical protein
VQDEVHLREPAQIQWNMHTLAAVEIAPDATLATLSQGGQKLAAQILSPAGARFEVRSVEIPPPQRPMNGLSKLIVRLPEKMKDATIVVMLAEPDVVKTAQKPASLDQWIAQAPLDAKK